MKYQKGIYLLLQCFFISIFAEQSTISEYEQKFQELQLAKQTLECSGTCSNILLDTIGLYGRCAGELALSIVSIIATGESKEESRNHKPSRFSITDTKHVIQIVVCCFLIAMEIAKACKARKAFKSKIEAMNYQEFAQYFPHLILVEYQIVLMKTLIRLSIDGTFPEQIFAQIQLTQMSLPAPYDRFANKCACKMYKQSFDNNGKIIFSQMTLEHHPYKKFFKKIPQTWQEIALNAERFSVNTAQHYQSSVSSFVDNEYNNTIIKMIHAGMRGQCEKFCQLRDVLPNDELIRQLSDYYHCT